jgi:hypothetical protein
MDDELPLIPLLSKLNVGAELVSARSHGRTQGPPLRKIHISNNLYRRNMLSKLDTHGLGAFI